ncbi:MAG: pantoate--beta-alanine ligase [Actinomycetota bacterium]|nr:pantoate--beta-alanine ligase [Actinomycetota bacterium]MDQ2959242.1 pantoate--beta-alanine ligase [Actinomycetota bacterium]
MSRLVRSRDELRQARSELAGTVGLVPTMGALHAGHLANIAAARSNCDAVVVSIFVNPMQFNQAADLERYPRPLAADLALCEQAGVDLVWAPDVDTVYRGGTAGVWLTAGALADQLEGPARPGHFDGMLTVVGKLFNSIRPDRAFFGEKDYQQLALIRRLVLDLDLDVQIVGVPTVREPDGLALSSRNVFLAADERSRALALSRALLAGQAAAGDAGQVLAAARAELARVEGVDVEYLELRDPGLGPVTTAGPARLLVAARVGATRLIDNVAIELAG